MVIFHMTRMKIIQKETFNGMNPEEFISGGKPEESFSQLIKRAISSSSRQRLFLTEIYAWILENYPYFKQVDPGWRNSVRHSLSTTKEFVRIKETRHKYNRGSEWCLADSELGRWYLHLTDEIMANEEQNNYNAGNSADNEFSRLLQLSTLIPELTSSMIPLSPDRPVLINLETCPDYLLGHVPHPELFVITNRKTPSPTSTTKELIADAYLNNHLPLTATDSLLGSPLSRKATPKPFDVNNNNNIDIMRDINELNLNIDMDIEMEEEFIDFH